MTSIEETLRQQNELCERYGLTWHEAPGHLKVGVAENVKTGLMPINGLRHPPTGESTGWYIWAGEELSDDSDFFKPLHVEHLDDWCPGLKKFLGLPPGWRFLTNLEDHEDVWEDPALLDI